MANVDLDASAESDIFNISLDSGFPFELDFELEEFEMEPPASPQDSGCSPTSGCFYYRLWFMLNDMMLAQTESNDRLRQWNLDLQEQINNMLMEKAQRKEKRRLKRMRKTIMKARKIMAEW